MGLSRALKKIKKVAVRSVKFQGKVALAPLKFAKKNPALTAGIVAGAFTGGTFASLGKELATTWAKKKGYLPDDMPAQVGEGVGGSFVGGEPGFGAAGPVSEPTTGEFSKPLTIGLLAVGGLFLLSAMMGRGK